MGRINKGSVIALLLGLWNASSQKQFLVERRKYEGKTNRSGALTFCGINEFYLRHYYMLIGR